MNGHRIHYDVDYCRNVEGYDNLVIHGPLSATLLAGFAEEATGGVLRSFSYRRLRPAACALKLTCDVEAAQMLVERTPAPLKAASAR